MFCNIPCRIVLFVVNLLSTILGLIFIATGALMVWGYNVVDIIMMRVLFPLISAFDQDGDPKAIKDIVDRLLHTSAPIGYGLFAFGVVALVISIIGFLAVCFNWKTAFHVYEGVLGVLALAFLVGVIMYYAEKSKVYELFEKQFISSVTHYKNMQTNNMDSLIVGFIMPSLGCCGFNNTDDFKDMLPYDKYGGKTFHDLKYPIVCCKMSNSFKILFDTCPTYFTPENSNVNVPCKDILKSKVVHILDYIAISMVFIMVLLFALLVFASFTVCVDVF